MAKENRKSFRFSDEDLKNLEKVQALLRAKDETDTINKAITEVIDLNKYKQIIKLLRESEIDNTQIHRIENIVKDFITHKDNFIGITVSPETRKTLIETQIIFPDYSVEEVIRVSLNNLRQTHGHEIFKTTVRNKFKEYSDKNNDHSLIQVGEEILSYETERLSLDFIHNILEYHYQTKIPSRLWKDLVKICNEFDIPKE